MKKSFLFLSLFFIYSLSGFSQNNLFFSHQALMTSYYNPALVGVDQSGSVSFVYRNQWTGYLPTDESQGGAPNTQLLNFVLPAHNLPITGLGINLSKDQLGPETNFQLQISTAVKLDLRFGVLQFGIMPGLYSKTLGNNLDWVDPSDPFNTNTIESQIKFNLGGGIYFQSTKGAFIGLAVLNGLEPNFDFGIPFASNSEKRTYVLHGGLKYAIGENLSLQPNFNLRSNLSSMTVDIGALLYYKSRIWTGLAYRQEEAAILFLGYTLLQNKLRVGYSFDYVVENQGAKNSTSHELFVRYNLPELVLGGRKTIKTPRFVF